MNLHDFWRNLLLVSVPPKVKKIALGGGGKTDFGTLKLWCKLIGYFIKNYGQLVFYFLENKISYKDYFTGAGRVSLVGLWDQVFGTLLRRIDLLWPFLLNSF